MNQQNPKSSNLRRLPAWRQLGALQSSLMLERELAKHRHPSVRSQMRSGQPGPELVTKTGPSASHGESLDADPEPETPRAHRASSNS